MEENRSFASVAYMGCSYSEWGIFDLTVHNCHTERIRKLLIAAKVQFLKSDFMNILPSL